MSECLLLVKNGVPWDVAMDLPADERSGMVIILGTLDGGEFDWQALKWKARVNVP